MVKRTKKILALCLALALVFSCLTFTASASDQTYFYFTTSTTQVISTATVSYPSTGTVKFFVKLNDVKNLKGIQATVNFNKDVFEIVMADVALNKYDPETETMITDGIPDGLTPGAAFSDQVWTYLISNEEGYANFVGARKDAFLPEDATKPTVVTLTLKIKPGAAQGSYPITITEAKAALTGGAYETMGVHQAGTINYGAPVPVPAVITTWPTVKAITYGQTFADALNNDGVPAAANPGTFAIANATTVPNAGTYPAVKVTFTPNVLANYSAVEKSDYTVTVNKANPVITWPTPDAVPYTPTLKLANITLPAGFTWDAPNTALNAGISSHAVTYTPADTTNYNTLHKSDVAVTVNKADQPVPSITTSKTDTTITITQVAGAVYGLKAASDNGSVVYGSNNVFVGLTPNTTYNAYIKLSATANYNESDPASVVVKTNSNDNTDVNDDKNDLDESDFGYKPGEGKDNVNGNIALPSAGTRGTTITWASDKSNVVRPDGRVIRPSAAQGDQVVKLTSTIGKGGVEATKDLEVTVKAMPVSPAMTFGKFNAQKPVIAMKGPSDVAVDAAGNIWVTDYNNNRVVKYDATGALIKTFGTAGSGEGQFNRPNSIAIAADGSIFVADTYNHRIVKFNDDGTGWVAWGGPAAGTGALQFNRPGGIAVKGTVVYVADTLNNRIASFDYVTSGNWSTFGSYGTADSNLFLPMDVTVDAAGDIWVADTYNNAVKGFDSNGNFIIKYAAAMPYGVAVDVDGNVYASERFAGTIKCVNNTKNTNKLDPTNQTYAGKGKLDSEFANPTGMTVDTEGNMWVVDVTTSTVKQAVMAH